MLLGIAREVEAQEKLPGRPREAEEGETVAAFLLI